MLKIIEKINGERNITFDRLGTLLQSIDFNAVDYKEFIPSITNPKKYFRNTLAASPVEVSILHWPGGVESAIHLHDGFWGYVVVLEGNCENIGYSFKDGKLIEEKALKGAVGIIMHEKDGIIHKLKNPDKMNKCVTANFYYPALKSMDNVVIYDSEKESIGILNEKAKACSWEEPVENFKEVKKNAFTFVPFSAK